MPEQARVVFSKLEKLKPGAEQLASVWKEIEAADTTPSAAHTPAVEEVGEEVSVEETDEITAAEEPVAHHAAHRDQPERPSAAPAKPPVDREFVADRHRVPVAPEEEFLPKMPIRTILPTPEPARAEYAQAAPAAEPAGVLGEFVSDLEASLGDTFLPPAAPQTPQPQARGFEPVAAAPAHAAPAHPACGLGRCSGASP